MPQIISTEPLAQLLRSIAHQERTGILRVEQLGERQAGRGELYFEKGHLTHAYCGQETGRTAVRHINEWKHIICSFHSISKPLPAMTRILNPSRERTEEKPLAPIQFAKVPQTENLRPAAASMLTGHPESGKNRSTQTHEKHIQALKEPQTEVIPSTHLNLIPPLTESNQPLALHREQSEASTPPTHHTRRRSAQTDLPEQELPPRLSPTPYPPEEERLPGRAAIFKARSMAATSRTIQCMTRRERIIFILLDGRRTIQDIARLTHQPESEVEQTLVHLTKSGYTQYIQG